MPARLPVVKECTVTSCAYNIDHRCHTPAITVGQGAQPLCDTYLCDVCVKTIDKGGMPNTRAQVGACKMEQCEHNQRLECAAHMIVVDVQENKPECDTFEPDPDKERKKGRKRSV